LCDAFAQIALLRDYLDAEFKPAAPPAGAKGAAKGAAAKDKDAALLPFGYDLERIIDDFVFLAMLVGNDFLPPLPTLDIAEGALNSLFDIYKEELPAMGGYLTNEGVFDATRLERILARLAALEEGVLEQRCVRCAHTAMDACLRAAF
jgi:5'-3' exonuclease